MTDTTILVNTLYNAYNLGQAISKEEIPKNISKEDAYNIQHQLTDKKSANNNDNLIGYKISLTSEETQHLFNSTTPLYGALTKSSLSDGSIALDKMLSPLIEIELMFIAHEDLSATDDVQSILQKMSIAPGLEIPDSRFKDWFPKLSLGQVIADSAVAGNVIVGEPVEEVSYKQLANIKADLTLNGEIIAQGPATEVLDNPVHAVQWLIEELAKTGRTIQKGMIISSGTFILPKTLRRGNYQVSFDDVGSVSLDVI
ncbi:2-keto-4-pentenoate hydratase [Virgibacillus litoralis]|uniref:2-keto-4-pentenoate hydratase n=1 Tax=Virgibacillus litoralis TaxID=578221 RepID=A0ABS4HJG5_9BACI|nr:2-keto-4-pentenoate hydratase [Virgibacillus litoralis]MBP1950968.1 2-keto-4-pentenoate hydratase [Virgibacillus litoralis]